MKVEVKQDKCIGCGACVAIAPENFDFNDDGLSTVISEEVTDNTRSAVDACPVFAIEINEESTNEETKTCECGEECSCEESCECGDDCNCGETCECDEECACKEDCNCDPDCECHKDEENEEA